MDTTSLTPLVPLHDAMASLESSVGRYLLAVQETAPTSEASASARAFMARSLAQLQVAHEVADEIRDGSGRPQLFVLAGGKADGQTATEPTSATSEAG